MKDIFINHNKTIDIKGLRCPEPIMMIRKIIRLMVCGETLLIISDDSSTISDIPTFCRFMGHQLIAKEINKIPYRYLIRKN
ncbi:MAG: sulfurtransferase TusA [Arsenophonus sp.]